MEIRSRTLASISTEMKGMNENLSSYCEFHANILLFSPLGLTRHEKKYVNVLSFVPCLTLNCKAYDINS